MHKYIDNRSRDRQGSGEIIAITTELNKFISTVSALRLAAVLVLTVLSNLQLKEITKVQ